MRALLVSFVLACGMAIAQEHAATPATPHEGEAKHEEGGVPEVSIWWKWANFAILAGGLGYLAAKNAPGFFASRNEEIQKGLADAAAQLRESNAKTAAMEARLANLQSEIASMQATAKQQIAAEGDRIQQETAEALAKLQHHAESEIASAAKAERASLKAFAADVAIALAEQKLRGQMTATSDAGFIRGFLKGMN